MNTTLTTTAVTALIAAGINLEETFPGGLTIVPDAGAVTVAAIEVPEVKEDGRNKAARAHNYEARMVRREATPRGGLTKAERKAIADANREELTAALKVSKAKYNALWTRLCKAAKA